MKYQKLYRVECWQFVSGNLECDVVPNTVGLFNATPDMAKAIEIYENIKFEDFDRKEVLRFALKGFGRTYNKIIKVYDMPIKMYNNCVKNEETKDWLDECLFWDGVIELDAIKDELFDITLSEFKNIRPYVEEKEEAIA